MTGGQEEDFEQAKEELVLGVAAAAAAAAAPKVLPGWGKSCAYHAPQRPQLPPLAPPRARRSRLSNDVPTSDNLTSNRVEQNLD